MCETLQLNWKLPTTPLEVTSSPLSAITDITTYNKQFSVVARNGKSPTMNSLISLKDQIISRKENLNNNRITSVRNKGNKAYRNGRLITKENKNKSSDLNAILVILQLFYPKENIVCNTFVKHIFPIQFV